jgi:hypothetical protein
VEAARAPLRHQFATLGEGFEGKLCRRFRAHKVDHRPRRTANLCDHLLQSIRSLRVDSVEGAGAMRRF